MKPCAHPFVALILLAVSTAQLSATESLDESINYLLNYVAKSDATFIRKSEGVEPSDPDTPQARGYNITIDETLDGLL